jgi:hypothetical protein
MNRTLPALVVGLLLAAIPPFAAAKTLRVAVISDLNGSYGSTSYEPGIAPAVARLVEMHPDLVISTGDMVAGQRLHPPLERPAVLAMWSAFHAQVTDPVTAAGIPFAATPGNHDASAYASFALERDIYREQWQGRGGGLQFVDRGDFPFHYAFAMGDVLFVSLDVTRVGAIDALQRNWLEGVLEREGPRYRHRVVFSHLPIYPFTQGRETEVSADHDLERLLQRQGVELYLSGHHHAFYPGFHGGIRHVGQACLGAGPRRLIGDKQRAQRAVTWLEFDEDELAVSALVVPQLERRIDLATLPGSIHSRFGTLVRDDLRDVTATPARAVSGH